MSLFWSFLGALTAVAMEMAFRTHTGVAYLKLPLFPLFVFGALAVNFSIYQLLQGQSLVGATVLFSMATLSARVGATVLIGDVVHQGEWAALGLLVIATLLKSFWR